MKHLYLLLACCLLPAILHAQVNDPTRAQLDYIFAPLDKSQVPTGLLADYALPLAPISYFGGRLSDSTLTSPDGFRHLYASLYTAWLTGTNPLPTIQTLNSRLAAAEASVGPAVIPLMVTRIDYARVRDDAFSQQLLRLRAGQVRDVAGRSQSPYQVGTAFAAAPSRRYAPDGTLSLVLPSATYVQRGASRLVGRAVDFGDGQGYRSLAWNRVASASYATPGLKRIRVRFTYAASPSEEAGTELATTSLESWFDVYVDAAPVAARPADAATRPTAGINGPIAPVPGVRAGGRVTTFSGPSHGGQIVKPLIVVEGYDANAVAKLLQEKNYSAYTFLSELNTNPSSTTGVFDFRAALDAAGYDIIFIDYDDGTDDIKLNAGLFKEVVRLVNDNKVGTTPNVVLGISMGGLVARYGLADMEKAQPGSSQTQLLVLQDSPQRGANVPLGIQALTRQANIVFGSFTYHDINQVLAQAVGLLDRPATQQLLLYQATNGDGGLALNTFIEGEYRTKISFPSGAEPYEVVAVSSGSQCGNSTLAPGADLARGDGELQYAPLYWQWATRYKAQFFATALPAFGAPAQVAGLHIYNDLLLFGGLMRVRVEIADKHYPYQGGLLPLDGAPGGTRPVASQIPPGALPDPINHDFGPFFQLHVNYAFAPAFCFVPTASSLDLADLSNASLFSRNINGVNQASSSRTQGFIAQEQDQTTGLSNLTHTTFTPRNTAWIFSRMEHTALPGDYCSAECDAATKQDILGPTTLCADRTSNPNATVTYTSPVNGPGFTYRWTATSQSNPPCGAFTVCSGTNPTFETANVPGIDDEGELRLVVTTPCRSFTFTKPLVIGKPQVPKVVLKTRDDCHNIAYYYLMNYDSTLTYTKTFGVGPITAEFWSKAESFTITAGTKSCGSASYSGTVGFAPCGASRTYQVYPNPASDQITVAQADSADARANGQRSLTPTGSNSAGSASFTVRLYDSYGTLRRTTAANGPQVQLNTSSLPTGLYVVVILESGSVVERRQVQVVRP